jgi:hypothetical protein
MLPFQDQTLSSSSPLVENNPATETRERGTQALPEEIQKRLKKSLPGCRKMLETKSEISTILKECLGPSAKNFLRTSRLHWILSLVWIFTMWP